MGAHQRQSRGRTVCRNRKALHDFLIEERIEAGMVLRGTGVKSLRDGRVALKDAYAVVEGGEVFLLNMHIAPWPGAAGFNHEPERKRKLLLHDSEIARLAIRTTQRGYTLVPLSIYFNERNLAKVELGLARGKHKVDKRQAIREREERRAAQREEAVDERRGGKG